MPAAHASPAPTASAFSAGGIGGALTLDAVVARVDDGAGFTAGQHQVLELELPQKAACEGVGLRGIVCVVGVDTHRLGDLRQLLVVEFDGRGQFAAARENLSVEVRLPQIHVEQPDRPACGIEIAVDRVARLRIALRQRAEADGLGAGGKLFEIGVELHHVPRHVFDDLVRRLTVVRQVDVHLACLMIGVGLQVGGIEPAVAQGGDDLIAQFILPDSADDHAAPAASLRQLMGVNGGVERRAAEDLGVGKDVKQGLAQANDGETAGCHRRTLCAVASVGW